MRLSVAYTFEPGLLSRLAEFPAVREIYGKLRKDCIGGGRSSYTMRPVSRRMLAQTVDQAHRHGIDFNYLINGANLGGMEQTRQGQRGIRKLLDWIDGIGVDAVTIANPLLLRLIKKKHPRLKVRVSVFAVIDSPRKARLWEDMGADTLCVSAIACNRDFERLARIREAVSCDLQLIANANCLPACTHELTHMNLLSQSSRSRDTLNGFCLDYCMLHCSSARLRDPVNLIRSIWIRPEDLVVYERIGYSNFKIVERSCPGDLLVRRVAAYANREFEGNLLELVGQVAQVKREQAAAPSVRWRMIRTFLRPGFIGVSGLLKYKAYAERVIQHEFSGDDAPVYIDNKRLDGFLEEVMRCGNGCDGCGVCQALADSAVRIDPAYRADCLERAAELEDDLLSGALWG